jgi:hypothetical protein
VHALVAEEVEAEGEAILVLWARFVHQLDVAVVGLGWVGVFGVVVLVNVGGGK